MSVHEFVETAKNRAKVGKMSRELIKYKLWYSK
jgi:hypothetical protein